MEKLRKNPHLVYELILFVMLMTLLLNQIDALPFATILRKFKYIYVVMTFFMFFCNNRVKNHIWVPLLVIFLFIVHTIIFGFYIVNEIAYENIHTNGVQMLWYLLIVLSTYLYVSQNSLFKEFITVSYFASGLQLLTGYLLHREDFVNPFWGLKQAFAGGIRFKTEFGFVHPGYLSNAAYLVFVVSIFFFELYLYDEKNFKMAMIAILIFDGLAFEMVMAAAERSGIISTAMIFMVYGFFVFFRCRIEIKTKVFFWIVGITIVLALIFTGVFIHIWNESNRALNIIVNYPIFLELGNIWTGMGFVDNSGFHGDIMAFGVQTSSLDLYYVYIFFTTGIVGCILIGTALIAMGVKMLLMKRTNFNILLLGLYASMLFFAFWQCNMVTYRYVSPTILFTILLCGLSDDFCIAKDVKTRDTI